ncbi:MAG: flagellar basal body rod protein FlgB [Candidatus Puniceispirillales bacterium]|jgi:flagellar basal-body rod protein FlgB|nr:flagellar basal body rod protein FlgB [Alphaproteobacteria bacterium]|tara:strand:- start:677 stop:1063 length:387 start_codon:yes stop_codon:yes gene_type:complete
MDSIKNQLSFYGSSLQLRGERNNIIASNIANAATPNYKARDISFEDEINKASNNGSLKSTHNNHIAYNSGNSFNEASYREPLVIALDGNTVELAVEQMQFSENTMRYQTTVNFLNGKIQKIMSAIRGE